jgi:hypothetical protein
LHNRRRDAGLAAPDDEQVTQRLFRPSIASPLLTRLRLSAAVPICCRNSSFLPVQRFQPNFARFTDGTQMEQGFDLNARLLSLVIGTLAVRSYVVLIQVFYNSVEDIFLSVFFKVK